MRSRLGIVCLLLFGSGASALVYQTVWLREFRLIFGSSTSASAAVLAIVMGGLGAGGIALGRRADAARFPLRFYAQLEAFIAIFAAASPFLVVAARAGYLAAGGTETLGIAAGSALRLILSAFVIGAPAFLMGGTLPAASRAVETDGDVGRRHLALAYGCNTLGAVVGVLLPTFFLLERIGNRKTLWFACALNLVVALGAFALSGRSAAKSNTPTEERERERHRPPVAAPLQLVLICAAVVGFVFFLMELVWYRMMTPLLGGSTFTFGLILAIALLGIGLGSATYAFCRGNVQPSLSGFAWTCAAEALFLAIPFGIGDGIAMLTLLLRPLGAVGFHGHVFAWTLVTAIVVLPASVAAGVQFPLLIGLLGKGRDRVGWHSGLVYGSNTLGAIAGSLAGGFGLLPVLSAIGAWRLCVTILAVVGVVVWIASWRQTRRPLPLLAPALLTIAAILMICAVGPTAAWRQSPIGAGRGEEKDVVSPNAKEEWLRFARRYVLFQREGRESCLGVYISSAVTFLVNGKSDGNAVYDAPTQIMLGLLGAILQPASKDALVVGLGTGSTAGWLGEVPGIERVDVFELEPEVLKVAALCGPVNRNVLANPKVHITIGDAREKLLTSRRKYDLIVSEPSNPYRAGIASLYTKEYYDAAVRRMQPRGLFVQFLQAYEVDSETIRSVYATFCASFPVVETWQNSGTDLVFIGALEPQRYDPEALRRTIAEEPFKSGLMYGWRVIDPEGVLGHFVANDAFSKAMARRPDAIVNTDDRNVIEFSLARSVGKSMGFVIPELRNAAHRHEADRPPVNGDIDWDRVDDNNSAMYVPIGELRPPPYQFLGPDASARAAARSEYVGGNVQTALRLWQTQPRDAENPTDWSMLAELYAAGGDARAETYIEKIRELNPPEADILLGEYRSIRGRLVESAAALESAYVLCRENPWAMPIVFKRSFVVTKFVASEDKDGAYLRRLYAALEQPFAVRVCEADRRRALLDVAALLDRNGFTDYTRKAVAAFEPDVPWEREFLTIRRDCYRALSSPLAAIAERELAHFVAAEPAALEPP